MRKKVIILIILILILLASIIYLTILKNEKVIESDFKTEDEIISETEDFEIENIEITPEEIVDNTVAKIESVEESKEPELKQETSINKVTAKEEQKKDFVQKQEITTDNKKVVEVPRQDQTQTQKQEQEQPKTNNQTATEKPKQEQPKQEEQPKKEETAQNNKQETPTQNNQEQIKQEEPKKEESKVEKQEETKVEQEKKNIEEYKINQEMINRIKTIIKNNETEDMKTYGYEIVVDSSIPELTNEFTFTEKRVINKITWSCGIIKIYARDYYYNGNLVSTQCFIL